MKKKFISMALLAIMIACMIFLTACRNTNEPTIDEIATVFRIQGFEVEKEGPILNAIRVCDSGQVDIFFFWLFSTSAGAKGGHDLMINEMIEDAGREIFAEITAHYSGKMAWFGTERANMLFDNLRDN